MDLRFEAAAANEFAENTKNDSGFFVPKIYFGTTYSCKKALIYLAFLTVKNAFKISLNL